MILQAIHRSRLLGEWLYGLFIFGALLTLGCQLKFTRPGIWKWFFTVACVVCVLISLFDRAMDALLE